MYRLARLLALLLLIASPVAAQPISLGGDSPGLRVYGSGGGGGVTGLTTNGCATVNAVLAMHAATANTAKCSTITDDATDVTFAGTSLKFASGTVLNFNAGDVTLTHAANLLTFAGGQLVVPAGTVGAGGILFGSGGPSFYAIDTNTLGYAGVSGTNTVRLSHGIGVEMATGYFIQWGFGASPTARFQDAVPAAAAGSGNLYLANVALTNGSGTGVTVNGNATQRGGWYKVTVLSTNCVAAATTCDLTIGTLPAKTFIKRVLADLTVQYACTAVCTSSTLSGTLGRSAGAAEFLASMDLDAAVRLFGDADAELGTELNAAALTANGALIPGVLGSWTATTTLVYRITSGTGNLGDGAASNLSGGSITFYVEYAIAP